MVSLSLSAQEEYYPCQNDSTGLWGFCDYNNPFTVLIDQKYEDVREFSDYYTAVKLKGKWGLIDLKGDLAIPCEHINVYTNESYPNWVVLENKRGWALTDTKNKTTDYYQVPENSNPFDIDEPFSYFEESDLFALIKKGKYGLMDINEKAVIDFGYDFLTTWTVFDENENSHLYAIALRKGKTHIIKVADQSTISLNYDDFLGFWGDYVFLSRKNKTEIIRIIDGEKVDRVPSKFDIAYDNLMNQEGQEGLVDNYGNVVIPFRFDYLILLSQDVGLVKAWKDNKVQLLDFSGKVLIDGPFDAIDPVCHSDPTFFKVKKHDKSALFLLDKARSKAKQLTEFKYTGYVSCKTEGIANVKINDKKGTVDKTGAENWINQ